MADLTLKRGDTYPPLTVTFTDASGAIDCSTASAVHMEMKSTVGTIIASLAMSSVIATAGVWKRNWTQGGTTETSVSDTWQTEFEIQWAGGGIQTVPSDGQKSIAIIPDIEGV